MKLTLIDWITALTATALCLYAVFLPYTLTKKQVESQIWNVQCDGINIQYHSPWPQAPADVCASIRD